MPNRQYGSRQRHQHYAMARGDVPGMSIVHKFGANSAVGTSFAPVTDGGIYRTPQVSGATALRVKAGGNANDTAAGSGAREITLIGLDETGEEITETVATAGASASSSTSATFIRLYRVFVSASGSYATSAAGSHSGDIVIENGAGTEDWATIASSGFPAGQSEIACYTVPLGKRAFVQSIFVTVDSNKRADVIGFQRPNILETAAPYSAMRKFVELPAVSGEEQITPTSPMGPYAALTDIGFMSKVASGVAAVDVDFEILLEDVD
jgi:hypothetical protein